MQINIGQGSSEKVQQNYFFEPVPNKITEDKQYKQILTKWGLFETLQLGAFRFNQSYSDTDCQRFLKDLFSNPNVRFINNKIQFPIDTVSTIQFESLRCSQLTTQMFQVLEKEGIVKNNTICGAYGDTFQGIQICNKLRECILLQQNQNYCMFDENQRRQLLFKVFQCLVIGGSLNQYQDNLLPYLEWAKKIYKSIVAVRKQSESENIFIESKVFRIKAIDKTFKQDYNPQNFVTAIINPSIRIVHVLSNKWEKYW